MGINEDKKVLLFLYFDIDQCWSGTVTTLFYRSYSLFVPRQSISGISNANRYVIWGLLWVLMRHKIDIIIQ